MFSLFNKTIKSILLNYIPHETITCDDKINNTYKSYILSDKNTQIFESLKSLQNQLKFSIEGNKENYSLCISKKLMDPVTSAKTYWSILKTLLNKKKHSLYPSALSSR